MPVPVPLAQYLPAGQGASTEEPVGHSLPASQIVGVIVPLLHLKPAGQAGHSETSLAPLVSLYVPAGQIIGSFEPSSQ